MSWITPGYQVFKTAEFRDIEWWTRVLGVEPDLERIAALDLEDREVIEANLLSVRARLPIALDAVARTYTREFHRVAVRRRHAAPLLDSDHGLVFEGNDATTAEWVRRVVSDGALVLADDRIVAGQTSQRQTRPTQRRWKRSRTANNGVAPKD